MIAENKKLNIDQFATYENIRCAIYFLFSCCYKNSNYFKLLENVWRKICFLRFNVYIFQLFSYKMHEAILPIHCFYTSEWNSNDNATLKRNLFLSNTKLSVQSHGDTTTVGDNTNWKYNDTLWNISLGFFLFLSLAFLISFFNCYFYLYNSN